MKIKNLVSLCFLLAPALSFADGHSGVGGGELCRKEIMHHRMQIENWIKSGDSKDINFEGALQTELNYQKYKKQMLSVLSEGKVIVTCYSNISDLNAIAKKYDAIPETVKLGGGCINYEDEKGVSNIGCDSRSIMDEKSRQLLQPYSTDENYQLVHHEYASIAKVEKRLGANQSDFSISKQLAEFQTFEVVAFLGSKKVSSDSSSGKVQSPFQDLERAFNLGTAADITKVLAPCNSLSDVVSSGLYYFDIDANSSAASVGKNSHMACLFKIELLTGAANGNLGPVFSNTQTASVTAYDVSFPGNADTDSYHTANYVGLLKYEASFANGSYEMRYYSASVNLLMSVREYRGAYIIKWNGPAPDTMYRYVWKYL
jgi:hypothetical protein